jgi:ankyrin repeat protein
MDLIRAVKLNALGECKRLVNENPKCTYEIDENGNTALHWAVMFGFLEICELLIPITDNKIVNKVGNTPLMVALSCGSFIYTRRGNEMIKQMINNSDTECINIQNIHGETILYNVASSAHIELCVLLIERGADTTLKDKDGNTAIDILLKKADLEPPLKPVVEQLMLFIQGDDRPIKPVL